MKFNIPLLLLAVTLCVSCENKKETLLIATAANMQFTVEKLIIAFEKETGIPCEAVVSSSGKLTAQIKEGAPFDIFISADTKYPNELFKSGFGTIEPKIYGYGSVVLWTLKKEITPSLDSLTSSTIKHIALANSKNAPYGLASEEILKYYNIYNAVKNKFVIGESIGQTNQFIISKAAEIGFTAKSVVLNPNLKEKGTYIEIDSKAYQPIAQSVLLLKNDKNDATKSLKFYNFLFSKKGTEILEGNGYIVTTNE